MYLSSFVYSVRFLHALTYVTCVASVPESVEVLSCEGSSMVQLVPHDNRVLYLTAAVHMVQGSSGFVVTLSSQCAFVRCSCDYLLPTSLCPHPPHTRTQKNMVCAEQAAAGSGGVTNTVLLLLYFCINRRILVDLLTARVAL